MKKLPKKKKEEPLISIGELPFGFTPTHAFVYGFKNGKPKIFKKKLTQSEIKKLSNEREES